MDPGTRPGAAIDRAAAIEWYRRNRERSRRLFDLIVAEAYYSRPIALRNPIVFYEGHLPAFSLIAFIQRGLGQPGVDPRLEELFARGIDPESPVAAIPRSGLGTIWPPREEVLAFGSAADDRILAALATAAIDHERQVEGLYTALEHEAMHQETLLYMWHRLAYDQKRTPQGLRYELGADSPPPTRRDVPAGRAILGARRGHVRFGWDNEFDAHEVDVPAFEIDAYNVTNGDFLAFVDAGGYRTPELWTEPGWAWVQSERVQHPAFWVRDDGAADVAWSWRGMFEPIPLPAAWPVYVSQAEAAAYARWTGRRLMTEAEWHRAALGTRPGNVDFASWEPVPAGSRPDTASRWGVHDLLGNGWEWTSTIFSPFPGFEPMPSYPEYSADFFDGQHFVMKGASPATAAELIRPSFRNWFRPNYPYVYATFRTVSG